MEALILLLISICLLSTYGFIYVSSRLVGNMRNEEERGQFRNSFFVLLTLLLISGTSVLFLIFSS
ncbi:hypothetical protein [Halalkalibacter alkalisediminis]|uniref:Uncharacterized protein n=1 Tax=Halalkalibacter alkalisediminis TaxID=935616 RepID=A0ABV6NM78_9BACI|nr:hypothetical protein [Halalkalibacter alkalisediminis]